MSISFMAMNISSVDVIPVDDGTVAYEITGAGPLVVCVPGMGDLRSTWRHLAPSLIARLPRRAHRPPGTR